MTKLAQQRPLKIRSDAIERKIENRSIWRRWSCSSGDDFSPHFRNPSGRNRRTSRTRRIHRAHRSLRYGGVLRHAIDPLRDRVFTECRRLVASSQSWRVVPAYNFSLPNQSRVTTTTPTPWVPMKVTSICHWTSTTISTLHRNCIGCPLILVNLRWVGHYWTLHRMVREELPFATRLPPFPILVERVFIQFCYVSCSTVDKKHGRASTQQFGLNKSCHDASAWIRSSPESWFRFHQDLSPISISERFFFSCAFLMADPWLLPRAGGWITTLWCPKHFNNFVTFVLCLGSIDINFCGPPPPSLDFPEHVLVLFNC